MFPPQGIAALLKEALVVYKGTTDSAGASDGSTLICSDLTAKADWDGNQIIITSGTYDGQARDINGATTGGTVTPASAFSGQIASGVTFVVTGIRTVPAEVADLSKLVEQSVFRSMGDISGDIFFVKPTGDDTNDGTTWVKAVKTIDHAMGLCTNDNYDGIIVARGDYDENANGALGVICDVSGVTILGLSTDTEISNTDTTDNGAVFTITGWDVRFKNIVAYKGETTSTNPVVFNILNVPWATKYTKLYGVVALNLGGVATGTILKAATGCNGVQIGPYYNENSEFWGGSAGVGIDFDATDLEIRDTKISGCTTGLSLGATASKTSVSRDSIIENCTTGILIAAGATNNIFNMAMPLNTTDITDNSGNATNDYHNSIAYIHHEMRHIDKMSGVTYYINGAGGADTNCGCNPDEAYATIAVGLAALVSGDRVVVMSKPGKYEETGLTMTKKGTELIFEPGAILKEGSTGDALTVHTSASDCKLTNVYIDNDNGGGKCFVINNESCKLSGCVAIQGTVGFDINSDLVFLDHCIATDNSITQFDISSKYGRYYSCIANGDGQAVRGFYLSDNSADLNTFISCSSVGNTTAGWEYVSGANENICTLCSSGGGDGAKVDNGTNNTCANCGEGSQIVAGQSRDQDLKDIYDDTKYILSTALTAPSVNSLARFIASGGTGLGRILPTSMSLIDLFGNFTGPYNGAAQDDNVKASLDLAHTDLDTIIDDTQLKFVAAGSKTIASSAEKYLSIDSGTDGAEIVSITIKGVVAADWTVETYIPTEDAVAAPAAGDKRDEDEYLNTDDKGGQLTDIGAIRYNMFLDITNDSAGSDNIDEVIVCYRSAGTLSLAWEA